MLRRMRLCGLQSVPLLLTCLKMLLLLHQFWRILSLAPTASEFILETDASYVGLGAVLPQRQEDGKVHPIAYASRSLDIHEKKYGVTELETLGLVWAVYMYVTSALTPTNAEVQLIEKPSYPALFVAISRLRRCYPEIPVDASRTGRKKKAKRKCRSATRKISITDRELD